MAMNNKALGKYGEVLAAKFLVDKGYQILEKNYKNKIGEIDLIVRDAGIICFVEVKTRRSLTYGKPYESVHFYKQRKIINVAICYLKFKMRSLDVLSRFDVISIYQDPSGEYQIQHLKNAFQVSA